jgi:glycosyltransferase involved in cell wall biosynthesis
MTQTLRVLHVMWKGEIGGTERAVYLLVKEQLRDTGLVPSLAFGQSGGFYWDRARELGCQVLDLGLPHGHALHCLPAVVAAIREFKMHHFHSAEPLLMTASVLCPNARRVYTHRGGVIDYPLRKRIQNAYAGVLLRFSFHGFSGNTAHGARCAAKLFALPRERFKVTYNGLDFDLLLPHRSIDAVRAELALTPSQYVIGTAANLRPLKGIERLVTAVKSLADPNVRLLVVGDGIDRSRLQLITDQLGLRSQVIFAGRRSHVADYLQAMNAFCLPTMGMESFGNAAVEAMAMGIPTIVFADGGGMLEHVLPGETGFVVADQFELVETLRRLAANRDWGRRIGEQASQWVRNRYGLPKAAAAYRSLYEEAEWNGDHA